VDGRIVAIATMMDNYMASNAVVIRLVVDAGMRGRGHGRAMAAAAGALLAERVPGPDAIDASARPGAHLFHVWAGFGSRPGGP
jgi:predicted GNAT family N-acyltransferase